MGNCHDYWKLLPQELCTAWKGQFIRPAYIRDAQAQVSGSPLKRKTKNDYESHEYESTWVEIKCPALVADYYDISLEEAKKRTREQYPCLDEESFDKIFEFRVF